MLGSKYASGLYDTEQVSTSENLIPPSGRILKALT